jgi:hypothetical protein
MLDTAVGKVKEGIDAAPDKDAQNDGSKEEVFPILCFAKRE